jgi:methyl-accepting chemotaxis protein
MSIKKKLIGGFALAMAVALILGVIGYGELRLQVNNFAKILEEDYPYVSLAREMQVTILQCRRAEKDFFLSIGKADAQEKYLAVFQGRSSDLLRQSQKFADMTAADKDEALISVRADVSQLPKLCQDYVTGFYSVAEKVKADPSLTARQSNALMEAYKENIHRMESVASASAKAGDAMFDGSVDEAVSGAKTGQWLMLIVVVLGLGGVSVVGVLVPRSVTRPVGHVLDALTRLAQGDLTVRLEEKELARKDEMGEMLNDLQKMADSLSTTVSQVMETAEMVASSAGEISQGNQDLSERTQQQASAIEETASAVDEMTSSVKQNAANSEQANELAKKTAAMAQKGGEVLGRTVEAMQAVTESSRRIADIINVVNEIAFQTNLLALNAAVEAARAGEAGRGFAVVAGEVRGLAGRSASAAKEIKALIGDSVAKVDQGNALVAESGKILGEIIVNVRHVADTIGEITAASREQASGIDEINKAVVQTDEAVQQNAALVEEAASASENMAAAAEELKSQMRQFKVAQPALLLE